VRVRRGLSRELTKREITALRFLRPLLL